MANDDVIFGRTTYPMLEARALADARVIVETIGTEERKERLALYFSDPAPGQSAALAGELIAGLAEIVQAQHEASAPRPRGRPRKTPPAKPDNPATP